jgi:hypothetical protein
LAGSALGDQQDTVHSLTKGAHGRDIEVRLRQVSARGDGDVRHEGNRAAIRRMRWEGLDERGNERLKRLNRVHREIEGIRPAVRTQKRELERGVQVDGRRDPTAQGRSQEVRRDERVDERDVSGDSERCIRHMRDSKALEVWRQADPDRDCRLPWDPGIAFSRANVGDQLGLEAEDGQFALVRLA